MDALRQPSALCPPRLVCAERAGHLDRAGVALLREVGQRLQHGCIGPGRLRPCQRRVFPGGIIHALQGDLDLDGRHRVLRAPPRAQGQLCVREPSEDPTGDHPRDERYAPRAAVLGCVLGHVHGVKISTMICSQNSTRRQANLPAHLTAGTPFLE
jgi:hypothetical protein